MSDEIKPQQIGVRASPNLWQQVRDAAKANGRSMNAEVISRLERSFFQEDIRQIVREELAERARTELVQEAQRLRMGCERVSDVVYSTLPACNAD